MIRTHDETSQALLAAAHHLLATEGLEALTVRRIATEAGMSTMNVYSRFGGKDGVVDELYTDGYERLVAAIEGVPETADADADLVAVATAYRQFALENPRYYDIMFSRWPREHAVDRVGVRGLNNLTGRIDRAAERGALHLGNGLDPLSAATWMWATCHGLVSLELGEKASEEVDWEHVFSVGVDAMISGVTRPADVATGPA